MAHLPPALVARLYEDSRAARWAVTAERFLQGLEASVAKAFAGREPAPRDIERYATSLHLEDLALACACSDGNDEAWEFFVREHRPGLYRAADAIDPTGGARELADAMYGDLFGLKQRDGVRQSLFRYFHGRSSLGTWLRAVLAQRHVDRVRAERRLEPLPDEDSARATARVDDDPERPRYIGLMRQALTDAVASLEPRDRLRLQCYYVQDLSLAAIGRLLREHEATVSRHLTRVRHAIRAAVERQLRQQHGFDDASLAECFASVVDDAGTLDLARLLGASGAEPDSRALAREEGRDRSR